MIKDIKEFKDLEKVYAIPTGNNARMSKDKIITFDVGNVGRVYVFLTRSGWNNGSKYNIAGATESCVRSGYSLNAGYLFFKSLEDLENYQLLESKKSYILDFFRGKYNLRDLEVSDTNFIFEILQKYKK